MHQVNIKNAIYKGEGDLKAEQLCKIVSKFFGYKAKNFTYDVEKKEVRCLLYDSFFFRCDTNDRYGMFGEGICFEKEKFVLTDFLGKRCSLNSDNKSICESLQIVDDYCRTRLPDKFLKVYDKVYK